MPKQTDENNLPLKIDKISQLVADQCMRKLFSSDDPQIVNDAVISFSDEKDMWERSKKGWALPPEDRTYFIVITNSIPLLLAGVNRHCGLSSSMKVDWRNTYRGVGKACVRALIEVGLFKMCDERGLRGFSIHAGTQRSRNIFVAFFDSMPKGIKGVESTSAGYTLLLG